MRTTHPAGARRPLWGWLTAEAISLTGTRVSMVALPWFVLTTTGSPTKTGLIALFELAPMVLLKVLGGPVIDRLGARRVAITCDVGSLLVVGTIPLLHGAGLLTFPLFLLLCALAGALRGPGDAAKSALVPTIAEGAGVPLERVTGLGSTVERTSTMLGAIAAGALVAAVGPAQALVVDALSFGLSALVLAWATASLPRAAAEADADPAPYREQLREGWAFLRGDRLLLGIATMVALTNVLDIAWTAVLVPVWAERHGGGAAAIGLLFAVFGGSSALGAVCAATWASRLPRFRVYLVAFLVTGLPRFLVLAWDVPAAAWVAVAVASGFASGFLNPVLGAVIFERIPPRLTGRVSSLTTAMCFALMPFGGLVGGLLIGGIGWTPAVVAIGVAYFGITVLPALDPTWREMDRRPGPPAASGGPLAGEAGSDLDQPVAGLGLPD